ncbi:PREDICTED: EUGRSUZ_B01037, partial [Prunus dulcis]
DEDSNDPDFEDSDYAQSDEEIDLLKNDDKWFDGYVDHSCIDNYPNAEENDESDNGEESPTLTCLNSSSSEDDAVGEVRRKKNRMPKGEDFRPEIDMANPGFKIGLKFATAELFRKAVKTFNPTHVCRKGTKNIHATAAWLAERYSGQLRLNPNWTASSFAEQVHQDYGYKPSRATVYRARAMTVDIIEGWFHGNPDDFCDAVYKKEAYLRAYEPMIMPMTRQDQWMKINLPPLLPPKYHKQPGRPKKTRKQAC